jgi:hypothetical protein
MAAQRQIGDWDWREVSVDITGESNRTCSIRWVHFRFEESETAMHAAILLLYQSQDASWNLLNGITSSSIVFFRISCFLLFKVNYSRSKKLSSMCYFASGDKIVAIYAILGI